MKDNYVFKNQTLTVIPSEAHEEKWRFLCGAAFSGTLVVKRDGKNSVFTVAARRKRPEDNPKIFSGKFVQARIRKNGSVCVQGIFDHQTDVQEAKASALEEMERFFERLEKLYD